MSQLLKSLIGKIIFISLCLTMLIIGVYVIPFYQGQELDEDQMTYMNYLLTLIASLATISGLGFALYGYYQSKVLSKQLKQVNQEMTSIKKRYVEELEQLQKAMQTISVAGFTQGLLSTKSSKLLITLESAQDIHPNIWGFKFMKAIILKGEDKNKNAAIDLLKDHLKENPKHKIAWIELIDLYLKGSHRNIHLAIDTISKCLHCCPDLYQYMETNILPSFENESDELKKMVANILDESKKATKK